MLDTELDEQDWDALIGDFKNVVKEKTNKEFPQDVSKQLDGAIRAVYLSWQSHRAKVYRKINQIHETRGKHVMVQTRLMVK